MDEKSITAVDERRGRRADGISSAKGSVSNAERTRHDFRNDPARKRRTNKNRHRRGRTEPSLRGTHPRGRGSHGCEHRRDRARQATESELSPRRWQYLICRRVPQTCDSKRFNKRTCCACCLMISGALPCLGGNRLHDASCLGTAHST